MTHLADLTSQERDDLLDLLADLDHGAQPVQQSRLPADEQLRNLLDEMLDAQGRVLVRVPGPDGRDGTLTTAPADDVAERLTAAGVGLSAPERVVIAIMLLRLVVAPTAAGTPPPRWDQTDWLPHKDLSAFRGLTDTARREATASLRYRGLIEFAPSQGVKFSAAILRITDTTRRRLEADLARLCADPITRQVVDRVVDATARTAP